MSHTPGPWRGMDAWEPVPREDLDGGERWVSISLIRGGEYDAVVMKPNPHGYADVYVRAEDAPVMLAAPDMLAALEAVEWTGIALAQMCPWCGGFRYDQGPYLADCVTVGHAPDCPRQLALKKARGG